MRMLIKPPIDRHSIVLNGQRTSVSVEQAFWNEIKNIASERGMSVSKLVSEIDANRQGNLSSAARLFVLNHFMVRRAGPAGNATSE